MNDDSSYAMFLLNLTVNGVPTASTEPTGNIMVHLLGILGAPKSNHSEEIARTSPYHPSPPPENMGLFF